MEASYTHASLIEIDQEQVINNRILVVDDDPLVIQAYLESLSSNTFDLSDYDFLNTVEFVEKGSVMEFEISTANQGEEAVQLVRASVVQGNPYAVAFIDVRMPPGMDGLETAKQMRQLDDNIFIIFITAYSDHSIDEMQSALHKNTLLMMKPFHRDVVLQMARTFCISWVREQCLVEARRRLSLLSEQMAEQVNRDALTGLHNRYYLDRQMELEMKRARREQQSLGVVMIDIDWFKLYNDQHGHLVGDQALKKISAALERSVQRPADFVARYGGEEFCMVLPNTDSAGVRSVAELVRRAIESLRIEFVDSAEAGSAHLTISLGGVSQVPNPNDSDNALIEKADQMLYRAKSSGKNCLLMV